MRRYLAVLSLVLAAVAIARAEKRIDERGGEPRAAWRRLGPEAKQTYLLGVVQGIEILEEEPAEWPTVEELVAALDAFFEDGANAYTPWSAAAQIALREAVPDWRPLGAPESLEKVAQSARAEWLSEHPKAARRARRGAGGDARLPAADPAKLGADLCAGFHRWLLREFQAAGDSADSALLEKLDAAAVELPGGRAVVFAGAASTHREHRFEDRILRFFPRDQEAAACSAVVVLVDGRPTRLDGVPVAERRRLKSR
ncbi:MAG: hypothetical protein CME06_06330 [Gemmatimonadetes bacterium]|nr:hypothetical protein [Gemmatimonadota bacterium]